MKGLKTLFGSLLAIGVLFSGNALAETTETSETAKNTEIQATETQVAEKTVEKTAEKATKPVIIGEKLNINTATASEIEKSLVGIGTKKAEAIVEYREKHGAFTVVEQLMEVKGIGKSTLERNKDRIIL